MVDEVKIVFNTLFAAKDPSILARAVRLACKKQHIPQSDKTIKDWQYRTKQYNLKHYDKIPPQHNLNPFEEKVIQLTGEDYSNQEIADKLNVSISYISHTKTNLTRRLNLENTNKLVLYGVMFGHI